MIPHKYRAASVHIIRDTTDRMKQRWQYGRQ